MKRGLDDLVPMHNELLDSASPGLDTCQSQDLEGTFASTSSHTPFGVTTESSSQDIVHSPQLFPLSQHSSRASDDSDDDDDSDYIDDPNELDSLQGDNGNDTQTRHNENSFSAIDDGEEHLVDPSVPSTSTVVDDDVLGDDSLDDGTLEDFDIDEDGCADILALLRRDRDNRAFEPFTNL